jgi:O-antigen/teichoic acid export membrane protein
VTWGIGGGGIISSLGWISVLQFVHSVQGETRAALAIAIFTVPMVLASGFQSYLLLGRGLVSDYNWTRLCSVGVYLAGVLSVAALRRQSVTAFAWMYLVGQFSNLILSTWFVVFRFRPRLHFNPDLTPAILGYGLRTQMGSLAAQTNLRADQLIMSLILRPQQVGLYVVAVSVSSVLTPLMNALAVVILPRTTGAPTSQAGAILAARHVRLACIVSIPVIAIAIAIMPWMLPAFFGRQFVAAVGCARILVAASLFQGLNAMLGNSLRGLGRPGSPAIAEGAGVVATIVLLLVLLPPLGIIGAAIASLVAYFITSLTEFVLLARAAGIHPKDLASASLEGIFHFRPDKILRVPVR